MESKGSAAPTTGSPPPAAAAESGASQYLLNLPSRGFFSSYVLSSSLGSSRVYVCDHETSPPGEQLIKTNADNILIRTLKNSKSKDAVVKDVEDKRKAKRSAGGRLDSGSVSKRGKTGILTDNSGHGESSVVPSEEVLQLWTVERLRANLQARGLPTKGKKDELIARLRSEDS